MESNSEKRESLGRGESGDDSLRALLRAVYDVRDQLREMNDRIRPITALIEAFENEHLGIGIRDMRNDYSKYLHDYIVICGHRGDKSFHSLGERLERALPVLPAAGGDYIPVE